MTGLVKAIASLAIVVTLRGVGIALIRIAGALGETKDIQQRRLEHERECARRDSDTVGLGT